MAKTLHIECLTMHVEQAKLITLCLPIH